MHDKQCYTLALLYVGETFSSFANSTRNGHMLAVRQVDADRRGSTIYLDIPSGFYHQPGHSIWAPPVAWILNLGSTTTLDIPSGFH